MIFSLNEMRAWRCGLRQTGRWLVPGLVLLFCRQGYRGFSDTEKFEETKWQFKRAAWQARLESDGKKHLVLIRYESGHNFHEAWVWNRADIDRAPVVWAADLGERKNQELMDYFKG